MMPVVILAGGLATRLGSLTVDTPKSLIRINEIPFVIHQLNLLKESGFDSIHFCLGYLGEKIEEIIRKHEISNFFKISFSYDGLNQLGSGGAIKNTLNSLPEFFFVMYGDSYLRVDYRKIETYFNKNKNSSKNNLMTIINNKNRWDKSNVVFKGNKILSYSKGKASEDMNYIDYGLSIFSSETFDKINKNIKFDLSNYLSFLAKKDLLLPYEITNRFYEVGSLKGINDLTKLLK